MACGLLPVYGASQLQEANTQPVEERIMQRITQSLSAANAKPRPCSEAKAAAATVLIKPFGTSTKERFFWPERGCAAKLWRMQQLTVKS